MPFDRSGWSNKTPPETNQNLIEREDSAKKPFFIITLLLLYYYIIIILMEKSVTTIKLWQVKEQNQPCVNSVHLITATNVN